MGSSLHGGGGALFQMIQSTSTCRHSFEIRLGLGADLAVSSELLGEGVDPLGGA